MTIGLGTIDRISRLTHSLSRIDIPIISTSLDIRNRINLFINIKSINIIVDSNFVFNLYYTIKMF